MSATEVKMNEEEIENFVRRLTNQIYHYDGARGTIVLTEDNLNSLCDDVRRWLKEIKTVKEIKV